MTASALAACGDSSNTSSAGNPAPKVETHTYEAQIQRTKYGIPHITAKDYRGMGYGYGYAYAQDNYCVLMKEIVKANGQSSKYFEGDDVSYSNDVVFTLLNTNAYINDLINKSPRLLQDTIAGYVRGMNLHLEQTGVDGLAEGEEGCRGEAWVREITELDLGKMLHKLILRASADAVAGLLAAQEGPEAATAKVTLKQLKSDLKHAQFPSIMPPPEVLGSNAYAFGSDATVNGSGLLLGNPHFPWSGPNRFYMAHLNIPGVYNAMGGSLHGFPLINVGFNDSIAWTHTVSTGSRFTLFELKINPENNMQYEYDGEFRDITTETVSIERKAADGSLETVDHTFYFSHHGPIVGLGGVSPLLAGWPTVAGTLYAFADANKGNLRGFDLWNGFATAGNMDDIIEASKTMGNPWTNTIAVDKFGKALYSDLSTVPNVTQQQYDTCISGPVAPLLTSNRLPTLNGSDSACEWGTDEDAPTPGIFGFGNMPKLVTTNHGANANDSFWLAATNTRLTGFSQIVGKENVEQSRRTRLTFKQILDRFSNADGIDNSGLFDINNLQTIMHSSDNYAAQLVLDDVLTLCNAVADWSPYTSNTAEAAQACTLMGSWDRTSNTDAVGAHVFLEFWREMRSTDNLFAVPFDSNDPINTPNTLNVADSDVADAVLESIGKGVDVLVNAGIALNLTWGDVQFSERNGLRIPIPGGSGDFSFSVISSTLENGKGYSDISAGNSYIQTVGWDSPSAECPDAFAVLTYSQSTDPASPHYADMTQLYSNKQWVDMPFCEADIAAEAIADPVTISEES